MLNILGQDIHSLYNFINSQESKNAKIHLYGKKEPKYNRKMGHITFIKQDVDEIELIYNKYFKKDGKDE